MLLDHKSMREVLRSLDKSKMVEIVCSRSLHSICSLAIFTQILKKEMLKYQVEFESLDPSEALCFRVGEKEFVLSAKDKYCSCVQQEVASTAILYNVAKSMDFLRVETVWPAAVCYAFYRVFTKFSVSGEENPSNSLSMRRETSVCKHCTDFQTDLMFSIRTLNCKFEGLFCVQRNRLDFLTGSTLFLAIKNDLEFILSWKLFYTRGANCDRKINEFLARNGISIRAASEQYVGLDSATKHLAASAFGEETKFIVKSGHDIEMSAIEHAFLIYFYLYKEKDTYAYTCLQKRKLMDFEKSCKFYHRVMSLFREAATTASKTGNLVFFKVKTSELNAGQRDVVSDILLYILRIYLQQRSMEAHDVVLSHVLEDSSHQVLYSKDCNFRRISPELREVAGPYSIKVCPKDLGLIVKQLCIK